MGSNSSVPPTKVVAPSERLKVLKQRTLSQATPSAKGPSNLTALRFIAIPLQDTTNHDKISMSVDSTTRSSKQATASDKETTRGESPKSAKPVGGIQVMEDGEQWVSREVERLAKKELDLEERENHVRERRLEINEEKQRLSTKEEDMMLQKLKVELKWKEFDGEKERLQKRYDWLVAEGIRQQRGESWLDGRQFWLLCQRVYKMSPLCCCLSSPSPSQKSEWEHKRKLQTEEKAKDQQYRFKELKLKREVKQLKREDERLRKKECWIEVEELELDREAKILVERNEKVVSEETKLRDDDDEILWHSFEGLKRAERYLDEKEKEIGKTTSEQSGGYLN